MAGTRILWGQIAVVTLIVVTAVWAATQWTAWHLGFQPQLGRPWFELAGWPVYYPPAFIWWYFDDADAPEVFLEGVFIAVSGGFVSIAVVIGISVWHGKPLSVMPAQSRASWQNSLPKSGCGNANSVLSPAGKVLRSRPGQPLR